MLPAKLRYSRRVWGGVAVEGWSMPVPGMSGSAQLWARGGRFCMQPGPGPGRGRDSERRLPGAELPFRGGGLHHSGDNYCTTGYGRVEMWRGGLRFCLSVAAPFVWRCLNSLTITPFPHPAHQTGHADFPHPAFGQNITPSPTARYVSDKSDERDPASHRGTRQDKPCLHCV